MKIYKIILTNFLILFALLIICEICCFIYGFLFHCAFQPPLEAFKNIASVYFAPVNREYYDVPNEKMRPTEGKNFKKNPIILFGYSVTYGNKLSDSENFSGTLSKMTKRPVYNMAGGGWTFLHMLKNLQSNPALENLNPDYVIYTFIKDQKRRLYFYQGWPHNTGLYLRYKIGRNNNLIPIEKNHYPFFWRSVLVKSVQYQIEKIKNSNKEKTDALMLKILDESAKIMKNRYPNAKLIFLLYYDHPNCEKGERDIFPNDEFLSEDEENEIKKMGYEIVNIEQEMGFPTCTADYKVDKFHPSSKFGNEFVPKLVEKYKM